MSLKQRLALVLMLFASSSANATSSPIEQLDNYRQQGVEQTDEKQGRQLWFASANGRSCTSCHNDKPVNIGKHSRTGKLIDPMAPSVNPMRYQNSKKIEKWFLRNCKWTFGRECSLQEKADILTWLAGQ